MKIRLLLTMAALCLATTLPLAAQGYQSTPVTVSQEKVTRNGKAYYCHTVLEHQTLFSISRTYGVSYQEITEANPGMDLSHGLIQTGQVLLIPVKDKAVTEKTVQPEQVVPQTVEYTLYTSKWYEDLDMIAAKFNISKEVLMAFNGLESDQIDRRQVIRIPVDPDSVVVPDTPVTPVTPAASLTPAASVTPAAPAVAEEPLAQTEEESFPEETEPAVETSDESLSEPAGHDGFSLRDLFRKKSDKLAVGILLPFNTKGQVNHSSFDLYSGMLLAVRDLAGSGIKADLTVIDSKNAATPVTADRLRGLDLVIGPIAPEDLEAVLDVCPRNTAVVSPLDPKALSLAAIHPNLIQAPCPAEAQYRDIVNWVCDDVRPGDTVFLITEKGADPTRLEALMAESGLIYEDLSYSLSESHSVAERLRRAGGAGSTVHCVIAAEREAFVNDVIRNVALLSYKGVNAIVYGPSKIRNFDMVEVENLHRAQAHLSCSYFIDYDNARIKNFLLSYRALFGAEPTPFAYQGYDAAWYFIRNFATSERDRERMTRMEDQRYRGLQSDYLILDEPGQGHVNQAVRRVVYGKDFTVSLLNP